MKKYVYPVILFEDAEKKYYTVLFPDLDIVASGETVEQAYLAAGDYLKSYLEFAGKMESQVTAPSTYEETQTLNPKRIVLLTDAEVNEEFQLTEDEQQYKNFIQSYIE